MEKTVLFGGPVDLEQAKRSFLRRHHYWPKKTADISRHHHWFPREMTSKPVVQWRRGMSAVF